MGEVHELAGEWLRFAREDREGSAEMLKDRAHHRPRHVCFAGQQAAEKAIKAVCVAAQIPFPFTHDLEKLTAVLGEAYRVSHTSGDLKWLSQWAVEHRYPGEDEPDWPDANRAVEIARLVVDAAGEDVEAAR